LKEPEAEFSCQIGALFDSFDPYLVRHALMDEDHGFKSVVFGWDTMQIGKPSNDLISKLFEAYGEFDTSHMRTFWRLISYW